MQRIKQRFIAMPNRHIPDLIREIEESLGEHALEPHELLQVAMELNNIPHWFEAEYEESPAATPGLVERRLVPGTLRDLGPASPKELEEYRFKNLAKLVTKC
jgi:hypothetical protein